MASTLEARYAVGFPRSKAPADNRGIAQCLGYVFLTSCLLIVGVDNTTRVPFELDTRAVRIPGVD